MRGDDKVVQYLNKVLYNELLAINQYFLHAKMWENWGLLGLYEKGRHEAIDEMKHAERLISRILFLEGLPNVQDLGRLAIGQDTKEILSCDLKLEQTAHADLEQAIAYCEQVGDYVSRDLFADIMADEEEHIDWLETQLELIDQVGIANYLQSQITS